MTLRCLSAKEVSDKTREATCFAAMCGVSAFGFGASLVFGLAARICAGAAEGLGFGWFNGVAAERDVGVEVLITN